MRRIEVKKWKEIGRDGVEVESSTLTLLNVLVASKKPEDVPRGIDKFRLYGRIGKAFDKADKTGILELEEADYSFLKQSLEKDVMSIWAMNPEIMKAVEEFLEVEEVK